MCGRYALFNIHELENEYRILRDFELEPNYNAAPTQEMPVITEEGAEMMRWGLIPKWAKDEKIGYKLINARSESVFEKPIWKSVITRKKCLIPANGFYEWMKNAGGKQPFFIHPTDQELFMFAGVWETWKHEGREWRTFSILTTAANKQMESIHDRMPVLLLQSDRQQWLEADKREDIEPLLTPYANNKLELFEVSKDVNGVRSNSSHLILPVNSK